MQINSVNNYNYANSLPKRANNNSFLGVPENIISPAKTIPDTDKYEKPNQNNSIGVKGAFVNLLKGAGEFFKNMVTDSEGKFSLLQTLKTLSVGALIGAGCSLFPVITVAGTAFSTLGLISAGFLGLSGFHAIKSGIDIVNADTITDKENAWKGAGSALSEGLLAFIGYRASGGIRAKCPKSVTTAETTSDSATSPIQNKAEIAVERTKDAKFGELTKSSERAAVVRDIPAEEVASEVSENCKGLDRLLENESKNNPLRLIPEQEYLPDLTPESIAKCEKHIGSIKIHPSRGLSGGHKSELYTGLRDTITETISSQLDKCKDIVRISVDKQFKKLGSSGRLRNIEILKSEEGSPIEFSGTIADNTVVKGILDSDGKITLLEHEKPILNIEPSTKTSSAYKRIINKNGSPNVLDAVKEYLGDPSLNIKEVNVSDTGNIEISFGKSVDTIKVGKDTSFEGVRDVQLILQERVVDGMSSYKQIYKFIDKDGVPQKIRISSKTSVDGAKLDEAFNFIKNPELRKELIAFREPLDRTEIASYIFKYKDNYYCVGVGTSNAGRTINTFYPVTENALVGRGYDVSKIPDLTLKKAA